MNPRETAFLGLFAAVFSLIFCQFLVRVAGQYAHLSGAQAGSGLTICLAGVVVGLLLVFCVSVFEEAGSSRDRSLGAIGLALGCVLLLALVGRHTTHAEAAPRSVQASVAVAREARLLAPGTWR
jgi:protein-S-isoprenylcysteine O-methyltransferase Ste14